jgi:hypothetical protein
VVGGREILVDGSRKLGEHVGDARDGGRRRESGAWEAPLGFQADLGSAKSAFTGFFFGVCLSIVLTCETGRPHEGGEQRSVRKIAPIDELDDVPLPAPLPLVRFCSASGCGRRARPGGRHCHGCHVAAVRRWREEHRREIAARRRDAASLRDDEARARDSARAKLGMALRRGTLERSCCRICGDAEVIGLIAEPARWREVVWICREHRQAELDRRCEVAEKRAAEAKQAAWYVERARVLAAIDLLPPDEQGELHGEAARGPAGMRLSPGAPLYVMNLVRVFNLRERSRDSALTSVLSQESGESPP